LPDELHDRLHVRACAPPGSATKLMIVGRQAEAPRFQVRIRTTKENTLKLRRSLFALVTAVLAVGAWAGVATAAPATGTAQASSAATAQTHYIKSFLTGKCVEVFAHNADNGGAVLQWDCYGGTSEQWAFVSVDGSSSPDYYYLVAQHDQKCLTVNTNNANGDFLGDVNQWQCLGQANQMWHVIGGPNGTVQLQLKDKNGCLSLDTRGGTGNGQPLLNWACNQANSTELWQLAS
jgi:hypothetical protein